MCEYCQGIASDDNPQEYLFRIPVRFGFGKFDTPFELTGDLGHNGLYLAFGQEGHEDIAYERIPVNYCPMCGESYENLKKLYHQWLNEEDNET